MHARLHTAHMYFLKTNSQTPGASVLLGDKSAPPPSPSPPPPCTKIKTLREVVVVVGASTTPGPSLSAGVIDCDVRSQCTFPVACQPDACWQVRSSPRLTAPARQGGCRSDGVVGGQEGGARGRKTAGGALAPDFSPVSALPEPAEGEPRPLELSVVATR